MSSLLWAGRQPLQPLCSRRSDGRGNLKLVRLCSVRQLVFEKWSKCCTNSQHSLLVLDFVPLPWPQSPSFASFCPSRQWGSWRRAYNASVTAHFSFHWTGSVWFKLPTQNPTTGNYLIIIIVIIIVVIVTIITTTGSLVSSNRVKMFQISFWGEPQGTSGLTTFIPYFWLMQTNVNWRDRGLPLKEKNQYDYGRAARHHHNKKDLWLSQSN